MAKKLIAFTLLFSLISIQTSFASNSVTVFAASSLTDAYTQLGKKFESIHPGIKIKFSFQASSTLLAQIKSGASADIFVSAEPFQNGSDYLVNRVVLGVPRNSSINKISDLNSKLIWIQCVHEVPCGQAADAALIGEGVKTSPASLEPKVSSAVAKLLAGEVDAAIIYRTDVMANSKKLRAIEFANKEAATTTYQIAKLKKGTWTNTFFEFLNSRSTMKFLQSKGFEIK